MTDAERQRRFRDNRKQEGLVDIRVEVPVEVRDKLKAIAQARQSTMKKQIRVLLEREVMQIKL